jgi:hypothetical protein
LSGVSGGGEPADEDSGEGGISMLVDIRTVDTEGALNSWELVVEMSSTGPEIRPFLMAMSECLFDDRWLVNDDKGLWLSLCEILFENALDSDIAEAMVADMVGLLCYNNSTFWFCLEQVPGIVFPNTSSYWSFLRRDGQS